MTDTTAAVPPEDRAAIEGLLTEFYWRLDHPDTGTVADLFTDGATLITPRFELSGRAQIAKWFAERTGGGPRITRHSWSNLRLTHLRQDSVSAEAHLMTAAASGNAIEVLVGDTTDLLVRETAAGWRFSSRRLTIAMEGRLATDRGHTT